MPLCRIYEATGANHTREPAPSIFITLTSELSLNTIFLFKHKRRGFIGTITWKSHNLRSSCVFLISIRAFGRDCRYLFPCLVIYRRIIIGSHLGFVLNFETRRRFDAFIGISNLSGIYYLITFVASAKLNFNILKFSLSILLMDDFN